MPFLRTLGDMLHLGAIVVLLFKMLKQRSAAGVSLKSMFLFALVFTTRYLDLFYYYLGLYNFVMKILYLATSYHICYLIKYKSPWKNTYDGAGDSFRLRYLLVPSAVLALIIAFFFSHEFSLLEAFWIFSQLLEAVAVLPQIFLLENTDRYDVLTTHYLLCLGLYRFFYIGHWVSRWYWYGKINYITVVCGMVQTILYVDFFFQYFRLVVSRVRLRSLD